MKILLISLGVAVLTSSAFAGIGEYISRVAMSRQIKRLALVEVDALSHSGMSFLRFDYDLPPAQQVQALVYEYAITSSLLGGDSIEAMWSFRKLDRLTGASVSIVGDRVYDKTTGEEAKDGLTKVLAHGKKYANALKLDYKNDPLTIVRLRQMLKEQGLNSNRLDHRQRELERTVRRSKRDLHEALKELRLTTDTAESSVPARVTATSPAIIADWPDMHMLGIELIAKIFELAARSAPDQFGITDNLERLLRLNTGASTVALTIKSVDGKITLDHDNIDEVVDIYLDNR
ncbi:MAG: hypothetical protein OYH77_04660 [Pseudomonadota bacterium]|nr:hypothetical protein [Pseudomonadota bacterium]